MKKNDGYILVFVLIVLLVLALVAVSVITVSMTNLHNQKASVQRMQDQYTAQGKIERVVSRLEALIATMEINGKTYKDRLYLDPSIIVDACNGEDNVAEVFLVDKENENNGGLVEGIGDDGSPCLRFVLRAEYENVRIEATVRVTGKIKPDSTTGGYEVTDTKIGYAAYTITTVEETGGGS